VRLNAHIQKTLREANGKTRNKVRNYRQRDYEIIIKFEIETTGNVMTKKRRSFFEIFTHLLLSTVIKFNFQNSTLTGVLNEYIDFVYNI
jgi:hypothetical protein